MNPADMQDTEDPFGERDDSGSDASPRAGGGAAQGGARGTSPGLKEASEAMVKISEREVADANRNAKIAIYVSLPNAELTEEQKAKKQKLIKQIEEELDL